MYFTSFSSLWGQCCAGPRPRLCWAELQSCVWAGGLGLGAGGLGHVCVYLVMSLSRHRSDTAIPNKKKGIDLGDNPCEAAEGGEKKRGGEKHQMMRFPVHSGAHRPLSSNATLRTSAACSQLLVTQRPVRREVPCSWSDLLGLAIYAYRMIIPNDCDDEWPWE